MTEPPSRYKVTVRVPMTTATSPARGAREIDWVTKYQLIERYRATYDLPLSSPQVAGLDLAYHDVHRGRGQYYLLQRSGAVDRAVRDLDIFEASPCRRTVIQRYDLGRCDEHTAWPPTWPKAGLPCGPTVAKAPDNAHRPVMRGYRRQRCGPRRLWNGCSVLNGKPGGRGR